MTILQWIIEDTRRRDTAEAAGGEAAVIPAPSAAPPPAGVSIRGTIDSTHAIAARTEWERLRDRGRRRAVIRRR